MSTVLTYKIGFDPDPLLASPAIDKSTAENYGDLTMVVTNNTTADLIIDSIVLKTPIGTKGSDLTNEVDDIQKSVFPDNWKLNILSDEKKQNTSFIFTAGSGDNNIYKTIHRGQSLTFQIFHIPINRQAGTVDLMITEAIDNNTAQTEVIQITKFPAGQSGTYFLASPSIAEPTDDIVLRWNGPAGATYNIEYLNNGTDVVISEDGDKLLSNIGKYPGEGDSAINISKTTTFYLTVTSQDQPTQKYQQTVSFKPPVLEKPVIKNFTGSTSVDSGGFKLALNWEATGASLYTLAEGNSGNNLLDNDSLQNHITIFPSANDPLASSYTLTAINAAGPVTKTINLTWKSISQVFSCGNHPYGLAVSPNGRNGFYAYVSCYGDGEIWTYNIDQMVREPTNTKVGLAPSGIVASVDGSSIYVANRGSNTVTPLSSALPERSGPDIPVGSEPMVVAISFDNNMLSVLNTGSKTVTVIDLTIMQKFNVNIDLSSDILVWKSPDYQKVLFTVSASGYLTRYNPWTNTCLGAVPVGNNPMYAVASADGRKIFVSNTGDDSVSIVDPQTMTVTDGISGTDTSNRIPAGHYPTAMAVSPDGERLYVASQDSYITVLDLKDIKNNAYQLTGEWGQNKKWQNIMSMAVTQDNTRLCVACDDGNLYIINATVV